MQEARTEQELQVLRLKAKIDRERYKANGPTVAKTEKRCSRCEAVKPIGDFALNRSAADGRSSTCRPCAYARIKEWRTKNPERQRQLGRDQSKRLVEKGGHLKYSRKYYANNKAKCHASTERWKQDNRDAWREIQRASFKRRLAKDPEFRFAIKIRAKIRLLLRGKRKSAPTEQLLGCKIADLRKWLELHWKPGMSWENYGLHGWHIDHIRPVVSFDLSKPEDQKACWHYTNLQPLWWKENLEKSDRYETNRVQDSSGVHGS